MAAPINPYQKRQQTQAEITAINMAGNQPAPAMRPPLASSPPYEQDIENLIQQITQQGAGAAERRQQVIQDLQKQAQAYQGLPANLDIAPLMALADSWWGGNLSKGYQRPETPQQRIGEIQALQQAVSKQKLGLSEDELNYLKDQLGGKLKLADLANQREMANLKRRELKNQQDQVDTLKQLKFDQDLRDRFGRDSKQAEGLVSFKSSVKELQNFVKKYGLPDINSSEFTEWSALYNSAKTDYAQAKELGALTSADTQITAGVLGPETAGQFLQTVGLRGGAEGVMRGFSAVERVTDNAFARQRDKLLKAHPLEAAKPLMGGLEDRFKAVSGGSEGKQGFTNDEINAMTDDEVMAAYNKLKGNK